jgi:hypothetical protein
MKAQRKKARKKQHKGKVRNIILVSYNSMYLQGVELSD